MTYVTNAERIGFRKGIAQGVQQGIAQGVQQGIAQGVQQGIAQGVQQGIAQGVQQGIAQGMRRGLLNGVKLGLELKFGAEGLKLLPEVRKIEDVDVLYTIQEAIVSVNSPTDLRRIYQTDAPEPPTSNNTPPAHEEAAPYTAKTPPEALREEDESKPDA
jgi:hypothetical protein